jgi:peptidoglycan/LPS O-acetylase OafA/YrhL
MAQTAHLKREIELDFIRGIAILFVLFEHYSTRGISVKLPTMARIEGMGWTGVDLFFVLSGFLVGGLLMREWQKTGEIVALRFLKRRAFKIWPAYYFFILVAIVARLHPLKTFLWQNLLNVQNYANTSLGHTWSLAVEEHFYLGLAALLTFFAAKRFRPATLLAFCLIVSVLIETLRAYLVVHRMPYFFYTHSRIDAMLIGVALACTQVFYPAVFAWLQSLRWALILIVAIAVWRLWVDRDAVPYAPAMTSPFLITLVDYAAAALLLLLYHPGGRHRLPYRLVASIGVFSYGIYLWHVTVLHPTDWLVARLPASLAMAVSTLLPFAIAIPLGIVATKAIEFPFLRLRERLVPATIPEPQIPAQSEPEGSDAEPAAMSA